MWAGCEVDAGSPSPGSCRRVLQRLDDGKHPSAARPVAPESRSAASRCRSLTAASAGVSAGVVLMTPSRVAMRAKIGSVTLAVSHAISLSEPRRRPCSENHRPRRAFPSISPTCLSDQATRDADIGGARRDGGLLLETGVDLVNR